MVFKWQLFYIYWDRIRVLCSKTSPVCHSYQSYSQSYHKCWNTPGSSWLLVREVGVWAYAYQANTIERNVDMKSENTTSESTKMLDSERLNAQVFLKT